VKTDKVRPIIDEVVTKVADKLDLPILGPMLEVLYAEWDLYKTLQNPNAEEWKRINEWKQEHPKLTQALEKLVNKPLNEQTKYQVAKSIKQFGSTRGGGVARPKRDGRDKPVSVTNTVRSTRTKAIQGGKIMATKPIEDKYSKEDWKKKKNKKGLNHPEWYIGKYAPTLVNLNYGTKKTGKCYQNGTAELPTYMPNVLSFMTSMTYPTDSIDSFNQAVTTLYTKLRAVNSGTTVYSVNDLIAYILNVRAFRGLVAIIHRAVQTAQMADIYDSQVPTTLLHGQITSSGSAAAAINNLAALRALGAQLDQQSRSMLPLNLPIIDRTEWIYGNVFTDSDDAKAQFYQFTTNSIVLHSITATNTYSRVFVDIDSVPDILSVVAPLLSSYLTTYISSVIAGDMIKAFGQSVIRPLIGDWYAFTPLKPIYDLDILQQIENANVLDWKLSAAASIFRPHFSGTAWTNDFATSPVEFINGVSIFDETPRVGAFASLSAQTVYVNSYKDVITPGDTLSSTRLKFALDGYTMTDQAHPTYVTTAALAMCGTEIIERMYATTSDTTLVYVPVYYTYGVSDVNFYNAPLLTHFDWHPMQFLLNNLYGCEAVCWDFKNFAHVSFRDIEQLHQYANYAIAEPRYDFAEQGKWAASNL